MPKGNTNSYNVTSSGTNSQGNHYCARDYSSSSSSGGSGSGGNSNSNTYHYSNTDVSPMATPIKGDVFLLLGSVEGLWTDDDDDGGIGSYYYSNPSGSTYYNDGRGGATYTAPEGKK